MHINFMIIVELKNVETQKTPASGRVIKKLRNIHATYEWSSSYKILGITPIG